MSPCRDVVPSELEQKFDPVIALLDEDKKTAAIGAIHHLTEEMKALMAANRAMFVKCMGMTTKQVVDAHEVNLRSFLARIFLYTVLINENTKGRDTLAEITGTGSLTVFFPTPSP